MGEVLATHFRVAGRAVHAASWIKTAFQPSNLSTTINLAASGKFTREFGWDFLATVKSGIAPKQAAALVAEMAFCWPDKAAYNLKAPADQSRDLELIASRNKQHPDVACPWLEEAKAAAGSRDIYVKKAGRELLLQFADQGKVTREEIKLLLVDNEAQARIDDLLAAKLPPPYSFEGVRAVIALKQELEKLSASQADFKTEHVRTKMTELNIYISGARGMGKMPEEAFLEAALTVESETAGGKTFVQYELVGHLGKDGGMGRVFTARRLGDEVKDRLFVIKVLRAERLDEMETDFLNEGATIAQVEHKGIVKGYGTGHVLVTEGKPKQPFMVMEKHQMSLQQALVKDLLTPEQKLFVLREVIEALRYTWDTRHLLHRDIKPDNILLDFAADGKITAVKVADFGLSKSLDKIDKEGLTKTAQVMGTTGFMAPEVAEIASSKRENGQREAKLKESAEKTDIYQLGNLAYRLLLRRVPAERDFSEDTNLWWKFAYAKGKDLQQYTLVKPADATGVTSAMWNFILRTMEIDPAKRLQNWAAVSEAVGKIDLTDSAELPPTEITPPPQTLTPNEDEAVAALRTIRKHLFGTETPARAQLGRFNADLLALYAGFPNSRDVADLAGPALAQINLLLGVK